MAEDADLELPRGVALAWGVGADPQRGPKREMSVEKIVDAAVELADAEGLGAVSMAAVAARLGYTPMSLYRYVSAKDDLTLLMQESATGLPPASVREIEGWRAAARARSSARSWTSTCGTRGCSTSRSPVRRRRRTAPRGWTSPWMRCATPRSPRRSASRSRLLVTGHVRWYGTILGGVRERRADDRAHARADHRARSGAVRRADLGRGVPRAAAGGRRRRVPLGRRSVHVRIRAHPRRGRCLPRRHRRGRPPSRFGRPGSCSPTPMSPPTRRYREAQKAVRDAEKALRDALQTRAASPLRDARERLARHPAG